MSRFREIFSDLPERFIRILEESTLLDLFVLRTSTFDRKDDRGAGRLRQSLGVRKCLVSWEHLPEGLWKARLSGPGLAVTIERTAKSRCRAILRAERAMTRILASRTIPHAGRSLEDGSHT